MESMLLLIRGTPGWVYLIFLYLVIIGVKAKKPSIISLKRLVAIALVFTSWSLYSLKECYGLQGAILAVWLTALFSGALIGFWLTNKTLPPVRVDRKRALISMPGSWLTLVQLLVIFTSKYYFGAMHSIAPALMTAPLFFNAEAAISALIPGLVSGRVIALFYRYRRSEHSDLFPVSS